jgi:hypothetical protein
VYNQTPYYPQVVEKPGSAYGLSLVGGIFILLGGIVTLVFDVILGVGLSLFGLGGIGIVSIALGVLGLVWGILVLVGAEMMNSGDVGKVRTGSTLVLIFSILSWFGSIGGFVVGFILGLIGSIMGLAWHPSGQQYAQQPAYGTQPAWGPQPMQQIRRICPQCGRVVDENVKYCPNCGKTLG